MLFLLVALCSLAGAMGIAQADTTVWYVDADSTATTPDGTTWTTAYTSIQEAIDAATAAGASESAPAEVWAAAGTYTAASDPVVKMATYVSLYGGFAGTETSRAARDWTTHTTTVDGESTRRCVEGAGNATLDGFTIANGHTSVRGAGMYNNGCFSLTVANCTFSGNTACGSHYVHDCYGGGMYSLSCSSLAITNCVFVGNSAEKSGGALCGNGVVTNCVFVANSAGEEGGGLCGNGSVMNCTFVGNSAEKSGGGLCGNGVVTNCILWGNGEQIGRQNNPIVTHSCIEGGYAGEGNTSADPLFWGVLGGDVRLHLSSPCINGGDASAAPAYDIRGVARPQGSGVDMGAYEMDTDGEERDTDGDGLADAFETAYSGTDPNDADSDNDGTNDGADWFAYRVWHVDAASTVSQPDGESWATAFRDIQSAVDNAYRRGGGEIWVAGGRYTGSGDPVVTLRYNVHLYGGFAGGETTRAARDWETNASTIDGESSRRCVDGAGNATLDGFTIANGHTSARGGGMYNNGCVSLTIANCTLSGNMTSGDGYICGGGMYNHSCSSLGVTDCTFSGNTVGDSDYPNYGGGMYNESCSSLTVTECMFSGNTARAPGDAYGGGMLNRSCSSVTVADCVFRDNSSTCSSPPSGRRFNGGGMYNWGSSPVVTNCTFSGNSADVQGGGMYNEESSPTVTNCTFSGNAAERWGGGMYNTWNTSVTVTNSTFWGNSAQEDGGGMYIAGCWDCECFPTTVTNCTFFGNAAGDVSSSVIFSSRGSSTTFITNCILWGNGGETASGDILTVTYSCVENGCEGEGNISENPLFWNAPGGDFRLHPSSPCVNGGLASAAPASDIRGVSRPQGGGVDIGAYEMRTEGDEGDTDGDGLPDGFETAHSETDPNDADSDDDGTSDGDEWFAHRVWYVDAASTAVQPDGESWATAFPGIQSAVNSASIRGGGEVWVAGGTYPGSGIDVLVMAQGVELYGGFGGTEATRDGRDSETNTTTIDGESTRRCVVGASNATLDGFAITHGGAFPSSGKGAGAWNDSCSSLTVANCTFSGNVADYRGAGMYNDSCSSVTLTNCTFSGNSSAVGGGITNEWSSPTVTNCTFSGNDGGGMDNGFSSPTVTDCTFSGNSGRFGAGGMCNHESSPTVTNCTFSGNEGSYSGGGMDNNSYSSVTVTNCTFSGNSAGAGGGMCNGSYSSVTVTNCTFSGNTAQEGGGGICNDNSSLTLTNCVLWGDSVSSAGNEIYNLESVDPSSVPAVTYCCISGGYSGEGNISADPRFTNAGNGDYSLLSTSPCVDAGTSSGAPATDIRGVNRPQGAGIDIGAYEYVFPPYIGGESWHELGDGLTLTVGSPGSVGAVTYEWFRDGVALGVYQPQLTIEHLSHGDAGSYTCLIADKLGKTVSITGPFIVRVAESLPVSGVLGLGMAGMLLAGFGITASRKRK